MVGCRIARNLFDHGELKSWPEVLAPVVHRLHYFSAWMGFEVGSVMGGSVSSSRSA